VPVYGNREWDQRSYAAPAQLSWRSKLEVLRRPRWLLDVMLLHGQPRFENLAEVLPGGDTRAVKGAKFVGEQLDPTLNWDDVARLRDQWRRPFLLKGILAPEDAERARRIGVEGIVLSNHGGRQLDGAVPAMDVLPEIAAAAGRDLTILIDGGIRRGTDIAKALALGARAVMIGRATLYGVSAGGQAGASHALEILRKEFDRTMALLGCSKVSEIGPHLVRAASGRCPPATLQEVAEGTPHKAGH
jgi:(S)-mandelate dehydrogenase